nr:MAG TPA: hypothetical protein [Caudoviricetes sp.]
MQTKQNKANKLLSINFLLYIFIYIFFLVFYKKL